MAKREKRPTATNAKQRERMRIQSPSAPAFEPEGNEPWRKYVVQPDTTNMPLDTEIDPERGIGARIAYCRSRLNNLSVEALSRYTKKFDREGISRTTLVRYESGDFLPGARELRILTEALWVSPAWLLLGTWENVGQDPVAAELLQALNVYIEQRSGGGLGALTAGRADHAKRSAERDHAAAVAQRQRWLHEARNPGSASG